VSSPWRFFVSVTEFTVTYRQISVFFIHGNIHYFIIGYSNWQHRHGRLVFTALHVMQTRYSDENSVCLSVCPSVRLSVCLSVCLSHAWSLTKRKKDLSRFLHLRKNIYPSLLRRRMVGGGRPLLPEILGQPTPGGAKSPILNQ